MPYGFWGPDARLRRMACARISDESLPVMCLATVRPRHGSGDKCQVCGQHIDRYRVEYQVTDARNGYELAFHLLCYGAWQFECRCLFVRGHGGTATGEL